MKFIIQQFKSYYNNIFNCMQAKPFLKWVGGKTGIIDIVIQNFPKNINNYYEPFVGGGSVLIELLKNIEKHNIIVDGKIYASDINSSLINCYQEIKMSPVKLKEKLQILKEEYIDAKNSITKKRQIIPILSHDEALKKGRTYLYYFYRKKYNSLVSKENKTDDEKNELAVLFIYINKTCWRGVYRENKTQFNVPFGNYKMINFDEQNIDILHTLFKKYDVIFQIMNFDYIKNIIKLNDFVYFDPPYSPINETSFTDYSKQGFGNEENNILFDLCNEIVNKKANFLLSNSYVPFIINKYDKFCQNKILCKRYINSKKPESTVNEILISNLKIINKIKT